MKLFDAHSRDRTGPAHRVKGATRTEKHCRERGDSIRSGSKTMCSIPTVLLIATLIATLIAFAAIDLYPAVAYASRRFWWEVPTTKILTVSAQDSPPRAAVATANASRRSRCARASLHAPEQVTTPIAAVLMSFYASHATSRFHVAKAADPHWPAIWNATRANHMAAAAASGVPYIVHGGAGAHPRCGKIPAVGAALDRIPITVGSRFLETSL